MGLASALTYDLRSISHDLHVRVDYGTPHFPSPDDVQTADDKAATLKQLESMNFGVGTAEKLPGNIGYHSMNALTLPNYAAKPIAAAMTRLADNFYAFIPDARAVSPITKTNWEGTGVEPDVPAPELTALLVAQKFAIQALSTTEKFVQKLQALRERLSELDSELLLAAAPTDQ